MKELVKQDFIERRIFVIRRHKVMLSMHLAELYGVAPKVLIQAVKRNLERFPEDFMFQLTWEEAEALRSQFVTLKNTKGRGKHIKYLPYVFTEQGVAMLSSILRSKRAVQVNIAIMRAFVRLRQVLASHKELAQKLEEHEKRIDKHDHHIMAIFEIIKELMKPPPLSPPPKPKGPIGFK